MKYIRVAKQKETCPVCKCTDVYIVQGAHQCHCCGTQWS